MRILRLVADGDFAVEFHPYVTVVTGLDDDQRAAVIKAFRAAVSGTTAGLDGLLEVHGVVLDLDQRSLDLLDLADVSVDILVDAGDLPGAASSGVGRQLRNAERRIEEIEEPYRRLQVQLEQAQSAAEAAREAVSARRTELDAAGEDPADRATLEELEAVLADAEAAVEALAEPGSRAAGELEQAEQQLATARAGDPDGRAESLAATRQELEARRTELVAALDPDAASAFEAAIATLRSATEPTEEAETPEEVPDRPVEEPEPADETDPAAAEARIEEIRGALALHESFDPEPIRAALDTVRLSPSAGELVPSPEALSLADRLEAIDRRIGSLEDRSGEVPVPGAVEEAKARLDEIRSEILELERTVAPSGVDADIAELEHVHAEVVEAREKLETRFGRGRAEQRYAAAVQAEEAVLDRLGIRSYTDFMTGGRQALHVDSEPEQLRHLRAREREMEFELRDLESRVERSMELAAAQQDRRELRGRARTMLGDSDVDDDELGRALLALRVPAADSTPLDVLLDALEDVGLPVRTVELTSEDAEAMAADWLDEYFRAEERQAALLDEVASLEGTALDGDDLGIETGPPPFGARAEHEHEPEQADEVPASEGPDRAAAQDAVRLAKDRMIAHEEVVRELAELDARIETLEAEERELGELQPRVGEAEVAATEARARLADLEEQRSAAEQRVVEARSAVQQQLARPAARAQALTEAVEEAEAAANEAETRLHAARDAFDDARRDYDGAIEEVAALRQTMADLQDEPAPVEEIEWYLLARLAGQRQVSFAGSVPMIIDRALDTVDDEGVVHLLERLERMAGAVQVVHLTDDERVRRWAEAAGDDRVAVVTASAAVAAD